jgi:hypothetical protein
MTIKPLRLSRWARRDQYEAWFRRECKAGRAPDRIVHGGHRIGRVV